MDRLLRWWCACVRTFVSIPFSTFTPFLLFLFQTHRLLHTNCRHCECAPIIFRLRLPEVCFDVVQFRQPRKPGGSTSTGDTGAAAMRLCRGGRRLIVRTAC